MRTYYKQLEFPFMIQIIPWDGQYTFTHWIAYQCFNEAAKGAETQAEKDALVKIVGKKRK